MSQNDIVSKNTLLFMVEQKGKCSCELLLVIQLLAHYIRLDFQLTVKGNFKKQNIL